MTLGSLFAGIGGFDGISSWLDRFRLKGESYAESKRKIEVLRKLWNKNVEKAIWQTIGGLNRIQQAQILLFIVCKYEEKSGLSWEQLESQETFKNFLRIVWQQIPFSSPPPGWEQIEQFQGEYNYSMRELPFQTTSWESGIDRVSSKTPNRVDRLKSLGNALVPQVAYEIFKAILEYDFKTVL